MGQRLARGLRPNHDHPARLPQDEAPSSHARQLHFSYQGEVYCTATFGPGSDWYRNITQDPVVEVWIPDSRWIGIIDDGS
jgi:hypothetical protein